MPSLFRPDTTYSGLLGKPFFIGAMVFLISGIVSLFVVLNIRDNHLETEKLRATNLAGVHSSLLQRSVTNALAPVYAVAALVKQGNGTLVNYQSIASELLKNYPGASALALCPDGVVKEIVPYEGNEAAVGHDLLTDPNRRDGARFALQTGKLTLSGPYMLLQGYVAAIGRLPVFLKTGNGEDRFWGFVAITIPFSEILDKSGLDDLKTNGYNYQLHKIIPLLKNELIASSPDSTVSVPVTNKITLPNVDWILSISPAGGWEKSGSIILNMIIATALSFLLGLFTFQAFRIRESELQYRLLADNAGDVIWIRSYPDLRLKYISPSIINLTGFTEKEAVQRSLEEELTPDSFKLVTQHLEQVLKEIKKEGGNQVRSVIEVQQIRKDGSTVWVSNSTSLIFNENKALTGILGISRDIQRQKMAELEVKEKSDELENFFLLALDLLCIADTTGRFRRLNKQWESVLGYSISSLENSSFFDFVHPDDIPATQDAVAMIKDGQTIAQFTNRYRTISGQYRYIEWHSIPYGDELVYAVARDITDRIENEQRLRKNTEELERLSATKDKFFSIVTHDLKSPFQGLIGLSDILIEDYDMLPDEEKLKYIENIRELSQNTLKLLENLLSWSRLNSGRMDFYPVRCNLLQSLIQTVSLKKRIAMNKGITLVDDIPGNITVDADENMLQTVVRNLISNAIKFTKPGGRITLSAVHEGDLVKISVADTGVGISEISLKNLFRLDTKVKTVGTNNEQGTGLGLLLSKEMVDIHNGTITVESVVGEGTTFTVCLPVENRKDNKE